MSIKKTILGAYLLLRLPLIILMAAIFGVKRPPDGIKPKKILLIRLDRLGDLVLTLPVIENLKLHYPDARLTVLVRPYLGDLARLVRQIDEVIVYEGFIPTVWKLRPHRFDIAIDMLFDYTLRSAAVAILSGAPRRVGFSGGFRERLFTDAVSVDAAGRSMVDINLEMMKVLSVPVKVRSPRLALEGTKKTPRRIVVLHPGAHYPSQRWSAARFADVARKIEEAYDVDVIVVGGADEKDLVRGIMERLKDIGVKSALPDMAGLAYLLARSSLLICNNSGPLHLAAALGVPTISMMGPTDPDLWRPHGRDNIVLRKPLECMPCRHAKCRAHPCMDMITADEVFDKVKEVLDGIDGNKRR